MNREILEYLEIAAGDSDSRLFADLTFGAGGHSLGVLENIKGSSLIAFDQDPDAYQNGVELLAAKGFTDRCTLHHANFNCFHQKFPKGLLKNLPG